MLIDVGNYAQGNRALASVLLLYYHLLREGGFTHEQTVYLEPKDFSAFDYLDVEVAESLKSEIDAQFIKEGAVICLLCDLNDIVTDYERDCLKQPLVQKIVSACSEGRLAAVPESSLIVGLLRVGEAELEYEKYQQALSAIFKKYVVGKFHALLPGAA